MTKNVLELWLPLPSSAVEKKYNIQLILTNAFLKNTLLSLLLYILDTENFSNNSTKV